MMQRVVAIKQSGTFTASDRVVLDADERQRRRIVLTGENGTRMLLDLEKPVTLRDGDGLALEDGSVVQVAGRAEPLVEVSAKAPIDLVRLAWHIGNRHTDIQFAEKSFRIRRDHVLEEMLKGLGAITSEVEASFDPEPVAPHGHHDHDHDV
jgi:urease accessory protein